MAALKKKISSKKTPSSPAPLQGLARLGYLYLATFLGLVTLALGSAGLINVFLESSVLPPVVYTWNIRNAISDELYATKPYVNQTAEPVVISMEEARAAVRQADAKITKLYDLDISERNRALSLSIVFVLVGCVVYFSHKRHTLASQNKVKGSV